MKPPLLQLYNKTKEEEEASYAKKHTRVILVRLMSKLWIDVKVKEEPYQYHHVHFLSNEFLELSPPYLESWSLIPIYRAEKGLYVSVDGSCGL